MDLKVETRNVELRKGWQSKIDEERERLIRHFANFVLHLRVSIEATTHHKIGGYELKLIASVPQDTVVVAKKGENVGPLLVEAFDVLSQQLKEILRKKRKNETAAADASSIAGAQYGVIRKLSPYESYGFIVTPDEREVYFHENALKDVPLDQLTEGDEVMYGESLGDKGPQASWVRVAR
ncbi:MAG: cold shock domain-containing protein [Proteobacteria bacterium]|nr:cold shock domain-containing protein [Pseudomonadota bacterium]MBU1234979.1 cold shock domain-containing protein [Pseudomonadota bacterium]MBU1417600.1 cold shock domain-containing protein [Pseudomonadota bacterium]MBU1454751.1 cold shock domain-containing protein [Pseudomonadota bacterium]